LAFAARLGGAVHLVSVSCAAWRGVRLRPAAPVRRTIPAHQTQTQTNQTNCRPGLFGIGAVRSMN